MRKIFKLFLLLTIFINAQSYKDEWSIVNEFEKKSSPEKALKVVENIYKHAKDDNNESEFIKALLYKEKYAYMLKSDFGNRIKAIESEINSTKSATTKLILKSIVAQMYRDFFEVIRYERIDNPYIDEKNNKNIHLWSLKKIRDRASKLYWESLGDEAKEVSIDKFRDILTEEQNSRGLRSTLYDFLAFRALDYFNSFYDDFYLNQKEAFSSIDNFIDFNFNIVASNLPKYKSILIYKKLLQFHKDSKNSRALEYVNLERLNFVYKNFISIDRDKYYLDALNSLEAQNSDAQFLYLAKYYYEKKIYNKALDYAKRGIESSDKYISSASKAIKSKIEERLISIAIDEVNLPNENILAKISYKNIDKLYLKSIRLSSKESKKLYTLYGDERIEYINGLKSINEINITLPKDKDYMEHSSEVSLGSYGLGRYLFVLSNDIDFSKNISYRVSTISKLAYFHKNSKILVVDRESGTPLEGVNISFYGKEGLLTTIKSDKSGLVEIPKNIKDYSLKFLYGDDILEVNSDKLYQYKDSLKKDKYRERLYLFTDKSIYRPSEKLFFKGLVVLHSSTKTAKIIQNKKVKIILSDNSEKELESKIFKTDEFGSIYGSFTIPKDTKLGRVYLSSNISGGKSVAVTKYKKNRVNVEFSPIDKNYRLGDRVSVEGVVISHIGNRLKGTPLKYRVYRRVAFSSNSNCSDVSDNFEREEEVVAGEVLTDKRGKFNIEFDTKSNIEIDSSLFSYRVAIYINNMGDIDSFYKVVNVGAFALNVDMVIDKELDRNQANFIELDSRDLNGNFEPIKGKIVIERFKDKDRVYRKRYWREVDRPIYTKEEFEKLFKSYEFRDSLDSRVREKIRTIKFDTEKSKKILLENLPKGEYLFTLFTKDRYSKDIKKSKKIVVYDVNDKTPPYRMALWQKADKQEYNIGSTATINIRSSIPESKALFTLSRGGKVVKEEWIDIKDLAKETIPILKEDSSNIFYSILMVHDNRDYSQSGVIEVSLKNRLNIEYISFQDRVKPNSRVEWKIRVTGMEKEDSKAQMVLSLYDASIDKFIANSFEIDNLFPKDRVLYYDKWRGELFFSGEDKSSWSKRVDFISREFYKLNWFGFKIDTPHKSIVHDNLYLNRFNNHDNFKDTLLFKPDLETDESGDILIDFKTNGTLNRWTLLALVHTKDLKIALTKREIVTKKEIVVEANLPKFFREDDEVITLQRVSNISDRDLNGTCTVELFNGESGEKILLDKNLTEPFRLSKESFIDISFKIKIPKMDRVSSLKYLVTVKSGDFKDIEESIIPIVSDRVWVKKSKILYLKAKESKSFVLEDLRDSNLTEFKNHKLIVEFIPNLAWYAIKSMPYIMDYPHNSIDAIFGRYFISAISYKLLTTYPQIDDIFKKLRDDREDNSSMVSLLDRKKLFAEEQKNYNILEKREMQHFGGGWSWFDKGEIDIYMTQYILEWFGKLKKFAINRTDDKMLQVAIEYLDKKIESKYKTLLEKDKRGETRLDFNHLDSMSIYYLYIRGFYKSPILSKEAYSYYLNQAKKYWVKRGLYEQAMIALTLNKKLGKNEAIKIANSIRKKAIRDSSLGLYFNYKTLDNEAISSIEKHTMIMELFREVTKDEEMIELMKIWLLKSREDNHWKTTKSTVSAIYALLSDNAWILNKSDLVDIDFNTTIDYKSTLNRAKERETRGIEYLRVLFDNFDKNMSKVKVTNPNSSSVWGEISWKYLEDLDNIKSFKPLPITISKKLSLTDKSNITIGDKVKVKIDIKVDRDMKFILLKDEVASPFAFVNSISKTIDSKLKYYKSVKDDAIYLFFETLPKGIYSFEYSLFVTHRGEFNGGLTTIKNIYSPNFINYIKGDKILVE